MSVVDKVSMERVDAKFNERLKHLYTANVDFGAVRYYVSDFGTLRECMHPDHRFEALLGEDDL
jgi:hypothetical protein